MVQTIPATEITLRQLKQLLGLQQAQDANFFPEWLDVDVDLSQTEQDLLDRLKKLLISTAIFRSSFSAVNSFSAPKSTYTDRSPIASVKGSSVIVQPSFSKAIFTVLW